MYTLIDSEHLVASDVDDTLVIWDYQNYPTSDQITIADPYTGEDKIYAIHRPHVKLLKQYKARGFKVAVWSKGGLLHSESVVKALGLEETVDFIMAKPEKTVDDKNDVSSIVGPVIYLKPQPILPGYFIVAGQEGYLK